MKELIKEVDKSLAEGWKLSKKIHPGGLFSSAVYEYKIIHNKKELLAALKNGYNMEESCGAKALNILLNL